ncbi:MAG: polysaccharide pyruvyl transferase family protein [Hyphomonas sp.]|nr:polysaccharide pyruvyl transferase family protein [Hyphomonas sp.]MCB9970019.1 polysaccharide pyruvyl transferase family protein [Hyphomonas sp.]
MKRYGILSIKPRIDPRNAPSFESLYGLVGQNTGNLLFTNAVWSQIAGEKERVGFTFDPEALNDRLDGLIIPAANWLSPLVDFSELGRLVDRLRIPVVLIGLGAQDANFSGEIAVPAGTRLFVEAVSARSAAISVRGSYTKHLLNGMGIDNVIVTGCPSLCHDFRHFREFDRVHVRFEKGLLHSTRFSADHEPFAHTPSVHREIFRLAFAHDVDLLIQSEREEMYSLTQLDPAGLLDERLKRLLLEIYGAPDWHILSSYFHKHCQLFFDVDNWAKALERYDYVFGTRLHGTIMALNSGVPAFMLHHDSRTRELCEFSAIPSADAKSFKLSPGSIKRAVESTHFGAFYRRREQIKHVYQKFLQLNDLQMNHF